MANQSRTIRIPIQSASKISKIKRAGAALHRTLGREPTYAEIAKEVQLTERTVSRLAPVKTGTVSLDAPIRQGETGEFRDIIPDEDSDSPDEQLEGETTIARMLELVDCLDGRERTIIKLRFGLDGERPWTLEEVSRVIGRTRERVRQIQNQALLKLRDMLEEKEACQVLEATA